MTGVDMLIQNLLRASGLDPEKVKGDIQAFGKRLEEKIANMDASMQAIREDQAALREAIEGMRDGQTTLSELMLEISRATVRPVIGPNMCGNGERQ